MKKTSKKTAKKAPMTTLHKTVRPNEGHKRGRQSVGRRPQLIPFDAARYLTDDAAIVEYLNAILETDDTDLLIKALGDVARARGMSAVAGASGLGRESLYKALAPGAKPRFDTIIKLTRALGVRMIARAA